MIVSKTFKVFPVFNIVKGNCTCGFIDCQDQGKHPKIRDWANRATHLDAMDMSKNNYGIPTGIRNNILVIDIDPRNGGLESYKKLEEELGELDSTWTVNTPGGGFHLYYEIEEPFKTSHGLLGPGIDVQGEGAYVMAVGCNHLKGIYEWRKGCTPNDIPLEVIPPKLINKLGIMEPAKNVIPKQDSNITSSTWKEIKEAIKLIEPKDYEQWILCGMALHSTGKDDAYDLWNSWSAKDETKYKGPRETMIKWNSFKGGNTSHVWIFAECKRQGHSLNFNVESDVQLPDFNKIIEFPKEEARPSLKMPLPPGRAGELSIALSEQLNTVPPHIAMFAASQILPSCIFHDLIQTDSRAAITMYGIITGRQGTGKSVVLNALSSIVSNIREDAFMPWPASGTALEQTLGKREGVGVILRDELLYALKSVNKKADKDGLQAALLNLWSSGQDTVTFRGQDAADDKYKTEQMIGPAVSMIGGGVTSDWNEMSNDSAFMTRGFGTRLELLEWGPILHVDESTKYHVSISDMEDLIEPVKSTFVELAANHGRNNRRAVNLDDIANFMIRNFTNENVDKTNAMDVNEDTYITRLAEQSRRVATRLAVLNARQTKSGIKMEVGRELMQWSMDFVSSRYAVAKHQSDNAETDESLFVKKVKEFVRKKKCVTRAQITNTPGRKFDRNMRNQILEELVHSGVIICKNRLYSMPKDSKFK